MVYALQVRNSILFFEFYFLNFFKISLKMGGKKLEIWKFSVYCIWPAAIAFYMMDPDRTKRLINKYNYIKYPDIVDVPNTPAAQRRQEFEATRQAHRMARRNNNNSNKD